MRFENPGNRRRSLAERKDPTFDKVPGKNVAVIDVESVLKKEEGALVPAGENAVVVVPKNEVAIVKEPGVPAVLPEKEKAKAKEEPETITKGKKIRATIVENAAAFDSQARDTADEKMTANKAELRGVKGFLTKIWKHNLAQDYYRQKEVAKAKMAMEGRGSLFEDDDDKSAHERAMGSIVKRFALEYENEEVVHEGESRETLDESSLTYTEVKKLIFDYAEGVITKEVFIEEKSRVLAGVINLDRQKVEKGLHHADDLLQVAEGVKRSIEHGEALNRLDVDFEIMVGRAKSGVRTEAQFNTVDRLVDKIQSTKMGRMVNETTVASGVAIAYAVSAGLSQRVASSRMGMLLTFGGTALVGAGIAAARESRMIENDRRQHFREMAKGKKFDPDAEVAPRRKEMEQFRYNAVLATECIGALNDIADEEEITPERFRRSVHVLGDINTRVHISNEKKIDLIAYSDERLVEEERLGIDIARAEAKINLKRLAEANPGLLPTDISFEDYLGEAMEVQRLGIIEGERGIDEKNRAFSKLKKRKVAKAAAKGLATGLVIGTLAQEGISLLRDNQQGLIEGVLGKNESGKTTTALEGIRRYFSGAEFPLSGAASVEALVAGNKITLPAGVTMEASAAGAFKLMHDGKMLADGLKFENGVLSQASREALNALGVDTLVRETSVTTTETVTGSAADMVKERPDLFGRANRVGWYDNNTPAPKFDENELRLKWGGKAGTGIDANGKVVFDVSSMTAGGSKHGAFSVNALEAIKEGKLKMLFSLSRGSQAFAVDVPVDASGKIVIDPNSEMGKMFFEIKNGKAVFKGGFAEVVHEVGDNPNGGKNYRILSTLKGPGKDTDTFSWERTVTKGSNSTELNLNKFAVAKEPKDWDLPPFIPVFGRQPLERTQNPERRGRDEVPPGTFEGGVSLAAPLVLAGPAIAGLLEYQGSREVSTEYAEYRNRLRNAAFAFRESLERRPNLMGINPEVHQLLAELLVADSSMSFEEYQAYAQERLRRLREIIDASERGQVEQRLALAYEQAQARGEASSGETESVIYMGGPPSAESRINLPIIPVSENFLGARTSFKNRKRYKANFSPRIKENPARNLDVALEEREYIERQEPNYKDLIKEKATELGPMAESCKLSVCIPVAGDKEGKNIYRTLEQYLTQTAPMDSFEIVLFVNQPETDATGASVVPDNTLEQIDKFKEDHPELPVRVMNLTFGAPMPAGYVRKLLHDTVLSRHSDRTEVSGSKNDHVFVSNDADIRGLSRNYLKGYMESFERNPNLESLMGQTDYDPALLMRQPIMHVETRLYQYIEAHLRRRGKHLSGTPDASNMAFRGSIYAAVGGYDGGDKEYPNFTLGRKIQFGRGKGKAAQRYIPVGYAQSSFSKMYTPFKEGEDVLDDDLVGSNLDLRSVDFSNKIEGIVDSAFKELQEKIEGVNPEELRTIFGRSLHALGVKYDSEERKRGVFKVTSMDELVEGLELCKTKGQKRRDRIVGAAAI